MVIVIGLVLVLGLGGFLLLDRAAKAPGAPWRFVNRERRLRDDDDAIDVYRRSAPPG